MVPRRRSACLLAAVVLGAAPVAAHAAPAVEHRSATAFELTGNGDDVIGPGEVVSLRHTIRNTGESLTRLSGRARSATPGVTFEKPEDRLSAYPDLATGAEGANATPFRFVISGSFTCGNTIGMTVALASDQGDGEVTFPVQTGLAGPLRDYVPSATELPAPVALADATVVDGVLVPGTTEVSMQVPTTGRVKRLEVRIPTLSHTRVGDLKVEVVGPEGTMIALLDGRGGSGDGLEGTVFAADGASLDGATAPFTGRYRPEGDLGAFEGKRSQGTWTLRFTDTVAGDAGTLGAWDLGISRAVCSGIPVASIAATPVTTTPGGTVDFDARGSYDDEGIRRYDWDLDGDGTFELEDAGPQASQTYPVKGTYPVTVRVTDTEGITDTATYALPVTAPPTAAFTATPTTVLSFDEVALDGSGSADPDGTIARYQWDLDGDGTYETDGGASAVVRHTFPRPGVVAVGLLVTDDNGAQATTTVSVTVTNRAPTAVITAPSVAAAGVPTTLSAAGSADPDGDVVKYEWDFDGDGAWDEMTASNQVVHAFAASGTRTVSVRVTDDSGGTDVAGTPVRVHVIPVVAVTSTPAQPTTGQVVTFDAGGTVDPDGTAMAFAWDLDGDGTFELDTGARAAAARSFPNPGWITVRARATDADGGVGTKTVQILVAAPPEPDAGAVGGGQGGGQPASGGGSGGSGGTSGTGATGTAAPVPVPGATGSAAPAAGAPGAAATGAGAGARASGFTARLGGASIQRLRTVSRKGLSVTCAAAADGRCVLEATLKKGRRTVKLGRVSRLVKAGRRATLRIRLTAKGRRALPRRGRSARRIRVVVRGFVRDVAGRRVALSRTVLVRR